jgi:NAD(P)-dependent dehydrogenase (short-subunit alcohol dehydrogenase family)
MGLVDGKCGIVTGAAGGLGRASALRLSEEGASVVVSDLDSQRSGGEETVALVEQAGGRAVFVPADVTSEDDQRRLVAECVSAFGRLDFAHNNAGVDLQATVEETTVEQWDATLGVNLKGVWLGMKHQLAQMRQQGAGAIVNTASGAGTVAVPGLAAYIASKHGVVGLTKAAALEAGGAGIRVNCLCPAAMRTPMLAALDPAHADALVGPQAIKKLTEPSEVADAAVWLISDRGAAVTGCAFAIDRGLSAGLAAVHA